jgi:peptidoglycan/LPS O-acetylase OafA/YrhL
MYKLSIYRTELMGFAVLWIFLFHSNIYIPEFLAPFKFIKAIGYSGVDIFFLLSGLGLSFSISKNTSLVQFYKKRLKRIIPTFWVCLFFYSLADIWLGKFHIKTFLFSIVGLDFLILQNTETWFIPSILICYFFFPAYYSLSIRYGFKRILLIFSFAAIIFSVLIAQNPLYYLLGFTLRIPLFIFGSYIGLLLVHKNTNSVLNNLYVNGILFFLSLVALIFISQNVGPVWTAHTGINLYAVMFMTFPLSMLVSHLLSKVELKTLFVSKILRLFGSCSLEFYLIHSIFFGLADKLPLKDFGWNLFRLPENLIYLMCSLFLSIILSNGLRKLGQAL